MDRISKIKLNEKHTIVFSPCWKMDIINGIGTCGGYDDCTYLDSIISETYFDCLLAE